MDATVAAGWIGGLAGLGGAIVGAGASIWATTKSQRHAAAEAQLAREHEVAGAREQRKFEIEDAKEQRLFELARGALDATLSELDSLRKFIDRAMRRPDSSGQEPHWERPVEEHLERIGALLHRIPNDRVRERLQRAAYVADRHRLAGPTEYDELLWVSVATREAIRCASAHLREQDLPAPLRNYVLKDELVTDDDDNYAQSVAEREQD